MIIYMHIYIYIGVSVIFSYYVYNFVIYSQYNRENPRGVVVDALDYNIVVSEFKLQWHYNVQFWARTLGKCINLLIKSTPLMSSVLLQGWL